MRNDERGYIVVETIGTFIPFVMLVVSILSLVNIVTVQSRVHFALTQAANTLSMYCYTLEVTGVADTLGIIDKYASRPREGLDDIKENINGVLEGIENLSADDVINNGEAAVNKVYDAVEYTISNPKESLQIVLNYSISEGLSALLEQLVRPIVGRYLGNGGMTGDQYLKNANVIGGLDGLDFYAFDDLFTLDATSGNNSVLLDQDGNIKLVVQYEIEYKFGALPLPFEPKLKVTQIVKTKAWLNGHGEGYK